MSTTTTADPCEPMRAVSTRALDLTDHGVHLPAPPLVVDGRPELLRGPAAAADPLADPAAATG
ncbi:hypothetical protein BH11ACT8_BH11ACT8_07550 [soil metagenome]